MDIPTTSNQIPLDAELVAKIKSLQRGIREHTIDLAILAFDIRSQHLSADTRKYDADFEKWWGTQNLDSVFGKRANFTKWAQAGSSVERAKFGEYLDPMPTTLTALYEVSQLHQDELKLCLQDRYTRNSLTEEPKGRKKPKPLIHPEVSAAEIKSWRKQWRNPKPKATEKRRLPFATLKVHGTLFDFDKKTGKHTGILTPEKLREIYDALIASMKPFDESVLLETKYDALIEAYRRRQERAEETAKKATTRKKKTKTKK